MKNILIFHANSGYGHTSLALAIKESIINNSDGTFNIKIINPLPEVYGKLYSKLNSDWKIVWGLIWHITNNPIGGRFLQHTTSTLLKKRIIKITRDFKPDVIISPVELILPNYNKIDNLVKKPKIAVYIADPFTPHISWFINCSVDLYLSPTEITTKLCNKHGISRQKIKQVGWLTRKDFLLKQKGKNILREQLSWNLSKFTIFVGGSGGGGGNLYNLLSKLMKSNTIRKKAHVVVNTGNNSQLLKKIKPLSKHYIKEILAYPFIKNIHKYLAASDLVIGKSGPNLLFECIHLGKPFIATGHLPGQEEGNVKFILDNNIGWVCEDENRTVETVKQIIQNPKLLDLKITKLKNISRANRNTDQNIAREISKLLTN